MTRVLLSVRSIMAMVRLIILDGLRRHALIGLILFALAGTTGGLLFFDFIPRDIGRATNDFLFSVIWLTGFIFLLFHAVQVMAWDNERGALHTFLARPISRTQYGLALFAGLAALLLVLNIILGSLSWFLLNVVKGSVEEFYFQHLSFVNFVLSAAGLYWIQLAILAIILFFSSAVRGSFPVLLLTICYYLICFGLPVVRSSFMQRANNEDSVFLLGILKGLTALFPDFSRLDFKNLVTTNGQLPTALDLTVPFASLTLYIIIVLWLACSIYKRRDLQ